MAEPLENEALTPEALDALMNAVDSAETTTAPDFAGDAVPETESAIESDTLTAGAVDFEAAQEQFVDHAPAMAAAQSARLEMASFDTPAYSSASSSGLNGFERVQDIPLELAVELGRTRLLIKDILELSSGSIVELEKVAGEPVDLLANGLLIARGEVVVIDDNFGVRVTEIITSAARKALTDDSLSVNAA